MIKPVHQQTAVLFGSQALLLTSNVTFIAVNGLAGAALASNPMLATLPITTQVLAAALCTYPASVLMSRYGRRFGFTVGCAFGIIGALLAALAVTIGSLPLLCLATFLAGTYNAIGGYLRFAAADVAEQYQPSFKAQAISVVLAGGVLGGILGPETAMLTRNLLPTQFAGTYIGLACFGCLAIVLVQLLKLNLPTLTAVETIPTATQNSPQESITVLLSQPKTMAAVVCGAVAYGVMNLLMTATPLAMKVCGYGFNDTAWVIEWHVIAMFAPGFFTGKLNNRFGVERIMALGGCLLIVAAVINIAGTSLWHFWVALVLLGLGWNWMFTGATTLLTSTYLATDHAKKARTQGVNDAIVFGTLVLSSLSSGVLVSSHGWAIMNAAAIPVVLGAMAVLAWYQLKYKVTS